VVEVQVRIIRLVEIKLLYQQLRELVEVEVALITPEISPVLVVMVDQAYSFSYFLSQEPKITSHSQPRLV
jgi:hypothetical protein